MVKLRRSATSRNLRSNIDQQLNRVISTMTSSTNARHMTSSITSSLADTRHVTSSTTASLNETRHVTSSTKASLNETRHVTSSATLTATSLAVTRQATCMTSSATLTTTSLRYATETLQAHRSRKDLLTLRSSSSTGELLDIMGEDERVIGRAEDKENRVINGMCVRSAERQRKIRRRENIEGRDSLTVLSSRLRLRKNSQADDQLVKKEPRNTSNGLSVFNTRTLVEWHLACKMKQKHLVSENKSEHMVSELKPKHLVSEIKSEHFVSELKSKHLVSEIKLRHLVSEINLCKLPEHAVNEMKSRKLPEHLVSEMKSHTFPERLASEVKLQSLVNVDKADTVFDKTAQTSLWLTNCTVVPTPAASKKIRTQEQKNTGLKQQTTTQEQKNTGLEQQTITEARTRRAHKSNIHSNQDLARDYNLNIPACISDNISVQHTISVRSNTEPSEGDTNTGYDWRDLSDISDVSAGDRVREQTTLRHPGPDARTLHSTFRYPLHSTLRQTTLASVSPVSKVMWTDDEGSWGVEGEVGLKVDQNTNLSFEYVGDLTTIKRSVTNQSEVNDEDTTASGSYDASSYDYSSDDTTTQSDRSPLSSETQTNDTDNVIEMTDSLSKGEAIIADNNERIYQETNHGSTTRVYCSPRSVSSSQDKRVMRDQSEDERRCRSNAVQLDPPQQRILMKPPKPLPTTDNRWIRRVKERQDEVLRHCWCVLGDRVSQCAHQLPPSSVNDGLPGHETRPKRHLSSLTTKETEVRHGRELGILSGFQRMTPEIRHNRELDILPGLPRMTPEVRHVRELGNLRCLSHKVSEIPRVAESTRSVRYSERLQHKTDPATLTRIIDCCRGMPRYLKEPEIFEHNVDGKNHRAQRNVVTCVDECRSSVSECKEVNSHAIECDEIDDVFLRNIRSENATSNVNELARNEAACAAQCSDHFPYVNSRQFCNYSRGKFISKQRQRSTRYVSGYHPRYQPMPPYVSRRHSIFPCVSHHHPITSYVSHHHPISSHFQPCPCSVCRWMADSRVSASSRDPTIRHSIVDSLKANCSNKNHKGRINTGSKNRKRGINIGSETVQCATPSKSKYCSPAAVRRGGIPLALSRKVGCFNNLLCTRGAATTQVF